MMLLMCADDAHLDAIEVHVQRQLGSYHTHDDLHAGARVVSQLLARHLRVSAAAEPA